MKRTRSTHRLAALVMAGAVVAVLMQVDGWSAVIVGLATILAGVVLLRPVDREPVVTADDTRARRLHPSNCDLYDWPEPEEGIER